MKSESLSFWGVTPPIKLQKCEHCKSTDSFVSNGKNPNLKLGVWKKGDKDVCIFEHSLTYQRNCGVYRICDLQNLNNCYNYTPK